MKWQEVGENVHNSELYNLCPSRSVNVKEYQAEAAFSANRGEEECIR
jgi:hypothetical protein